MPDWAAEVDLSALEAWMDERNLEDGPVSGAHPLVGGTQNRLLRFRRGGREFVLRGPPPHPRPKSNETMRREMRLLAALARTDVPHARLIAACPRTEVLGAAFYLMEPVNGFNPANGLPSPHTDHPAWRGRMGFAIVEGLAALGALEPSALGLDGFGRPEGFLERQAPRWRAQYAAYGSAPGWSASRALPGLDRVADWLETCRPHRFTPGLMHGDYHLANVMFRFDAPELAAIVDWELATVGDPLIDLGWLLATWPEGEEAPSGPVVVSPWGGFPTARDMIDRYRQQSVRDLSALAWYEVMGCFKLAIILEGTRARALAGEAPMAIGEVLHNHAVGLMERALRHLARSPSKAIPRGGSE